MAISATGHTLIQNYLKPAWLKITSVFRHRKVRVLSKEELQERPLGHLPPTEIPNPTKQRSAAPVHTGPLMPRPHVPKDPAGKFLKAPGASPVNISRFMADLNVLGGKVKASLFPDNSEIETAARLLDAAKSEDWQAVHTHLQQLSESWHEDLTRLIRTSSKLASSGALDEVPDRPVTDFLSHPVTPVESPESVSEEEISEAFDEFILARNPRIETQAEVEAEPQPRTEPQIELEVEPQTAPLIEPEITAEAVTEAPEPLTEPVEVDLIDWLPPLPEANTSTANVTLRSTTGRSLSLANVPVDTSFTDLLVEWAWSQDLQLSNMPTCTVDGKEVPTDEKLRHLQADRDIEVALVTLPPERQIQLQSTIAELLPPGTNSFIPAGQGSTECLDWAVLNVCQQAKNDPASLNPEAVGKLQRILTGASQSLGHIPPHERQLAAQYLNRLLSLLQLPASAASDKSHSLIQPQESRAMTLLYNRNRPLVKEFLPEGKWYRDFIDNEPDGYFLSMLPEATIEKAFEDEVRLYHRHFGQLLSLNELSRIFEHCVKTCIRSSQSKDGTEQLRQKLLNKSLNWKARKSPYQPVNTSGAIALADLRLKKHQSPESTRHQFRLNIHPLDLERAWPLIARIITREDCPFISWKCQLPDPGKVSDTKKELSNFGGQFTLQSLANIRKKRFSEQKIAHCLAEINSELMNHGIRPGVLPDNDIPIPGAPYAGYHYTQDRENNQYEPAEVVDDARKLEYQNQPRYQAVSSYLAPGR